MFVVCGCGGVVVVCVLFCLCLLLWLSGRVVITFSLKLIWNLANIKQKMRSEIIQVRSLAWGLQQQNVVCNVSFQCLVRSPDSG